MTIMDTLTGYNTGCFQCRGVAHLKSGGRGHYVECKTCYIRTGDYIYAKDAVTSFEGFKQSVTDAWFTDPPEHAGDYVCWFGDRHYEYCHYLKRQKKWWSIKDQKTVEPLKWTHCAEQPAGNKRAD